MGYSARMVRFLLLLPGCVVLLIAGTLVLRPDPVARNIRAAEGLWSAGRIAEARQRWLMTERAGAAPPLVNVRLAQIALLRGECADAAPRAATALLNGALLRRDEAAAMHLVAGQCAALSDSVARSDAEWSSVDPRSPLKPLADLLRGERELRAGRAIPAIARYEAALNTPVPEPWRSLARLRLALLKADTMPAEAAQHLAAIAATPPPPDVETRPFLPLSIVDIAVQARQLGAILPVGEPQRSQLLGQQLLNLGLYRLAIARFERVSPDAPNAVAASVQAAFARWQIGQTGAAKAQLRELAAYAPQEPIVATLYATVALRDNDLDAAAAALDRAEAAYPLDPALALVRSDVLAARRDYPRAIDELRRARDLAQPEVKPRYALALAQQYLTLTYDLCNGGRAAAGDATTIAPTDPAAWQMLATVLYHCRAYNEAADAARTGLQYAPASAALTWLLGAALLERGDPAADAALIRAADLAPAGEWRARAEQLLGW